MNIVVSGKGIVSAIGNTSHEVLTALREHVTGVAQRQFLHTTHDRLPVGEVKLSNDAMKQMLGIDTATEVSRTVLMGILAARQAIDEAAIETTKRIVLISGTTVGGMDITELHFNDMRNGVCGDYQGGHDCGSSTHQIADYFGFFDDTCTISTACSSAANAIMLGAELIKRGDADVVVAGGSEALSRFHLNGFNSLMILDKEVCRPMDATRAGLNLGEGAAFVVLEREQDAIDRNVAIQAYVSGYGNACDAFHQTASSDDGRGAYLAMNKALAMAGLKPTDIDYINAHGTGTPNNDKSESTSIQRIWGDAIPPVSSTKSFTGHTTSASGSIESVICLLAMQHGFIPINLGFAHTIDGGFAPNMDDSPRVLNHVMCNSFGFGGNDSSLIFSTRPTATQQTYSTTKVKIVAQAQIDSEDELASIKQYVKPLEARRMGKIMKAATITSQRVLDEAGIATPDAVVTGTTWGCLENSEKLLIQLETEGEATVSPTHFMQSTHNTIGSAIAIRTKCHGYNITYSHGDDSLKWALRDAERLLQSGECKTVLVGCHDESTPLFATLTGKPVGDLHSMSMLLTLDD